MFDVYKIARLAWLDQVFTDINLDHSAQNVAFHLSRYFSSHVFVMEAELRTIVVQAVVAGKAGISGRTVKRGIASLRQNGHLDITRLNFGAGTGREYVAVLRPKVDRGVADLASPRLSSMAEDVN